MKNDVARTINVSDMQKIKYCSSFERGSNSTKPLADESINPSDQVVNKNSSETSNLENMENEVLPQDSNYAKKTKNMKMSVLYH